MHGLPPRLREQRLSLDMSQEAFAEACGVKRRAQAAYEAGDRVPSADYLIKAGQLGADLKYILTGVRSSGIEKERLAIEWLLRELFRQLEIPAEVTEPTIAQAASIDAAASEGVSKASALRELATRALMRSVRLTRSEVHTTLDRDLLCDVIREQEAAWARAQKRPSPIHKSHRFASLYEAAIESGRLNRDLIEGPERDPPAAGK